MLKKEKTVKLSGLLGILFLVLSAAGLACLCYFTKGEDIWYDEVFSVIYAKKDFARIVSLTAADVHPPLYYWYLRLFTLAGGALFPKAGYITLCKAASILPLIGIFALSLTVLRKRSSFFHAAFFLFLLIFMPQLTGYYVEIRMYALALFFLTGMFSSIPGIRLAPGDTPGEAGRTERGSFVFFCIFGILAAYTQYFALVGAAGLYLFCGIVLLCRKKKKKFGKLCICAGITAVSYLPWLPSFVKQLTAVQGSYWIQPLGLRSIPGVVKYIYLPVLTGGSWDYYPAALMLLATAVLLILRFRKDGWKGLLPLGTGIFLIAFILGTGFVFSLSGHPIFTYRYLVPVLGIFWFGVSMLFPSELIDKKPVPWRNFLILILLVPFLFGAWCSLKSLRQEEGKKVQEMSKTMEALKEIEDGSVVITNFDQVTALMDFYLNVLLEKNADIKLYESETEPAVQLLFDTDGQSVTENELPGLIEGRPDGKLYFFGSFASRDDLLAEWESIGIKSSEQGSFLLERYWFNRYILATKGGT